MKNLKNQVINLKCTMEDLRDDVKLSKDQKQQIINFYLEACYTVATDPLLSK